MDFAKFQQRRRSGTQERADPKTARLPSGRLRPIAATNARTVAELRQLTEMNQHDFAAAYGIPLGTLRNWEQGRRACPDYVLDLLAYTIYVPDELRIRQIASALRF